MMRLWIALFLFLTCSLWAKASPHPYQISVSHIEPKGIGYEEGYTSLALFFAWPKKNSDWTLFWDARGHVFNQGQPAVNSGLGVRYRRMSRLYGINTYYDFRQSHANYNQISLGLESLGKNWDFRINGYLPVGKTEIKYYATFLGLRNRLLIFAHRKEFALSCVQAESTFHLDEIPVPLSFSIGSYWLNGFNQNGWGGEVRFTVNFFDYAWIEGNASYDNLFKWIGQGRLGLSVPFGPRKKGKKACTFRRLSVQKVCRREIIPLDRKYFQGPFINPKTGEPYSY